MLEPQLSDRGRAVRAYEILDTAPEAAFDDIAAFAARLCGAPVAMVNLLDDFRQFTKARFGDLDPPTRIEDALCRHPVSTGEYTEIPDLLKDPTAAGLVAGQGVRFYAGAPLVTPEGVAVGSLCVVDYRVRSLDPLQRDGLEVLARQVVAQLELRRALSEADVLRREVDHRVKNSLQSLSAYTRLHGRLARSDEAREALAAVGRRIVAVTQVHDQLYQTGATATVALDGYVNTMRAHLSGLAPAGVEIRASVDPIAMRSQEAAALGTLLNELVANSFKHAFDGREGGRIDITLRRKDNNGIAFEYRDDGRGLPGDLAGGGLGFKVIEMMGSQLGGPVEFPRSETGFHARGSFQLAGAV